MLAFAKVLQPSRGAQRVALSIHEIRTVCLRYK
jgi:hypothetical protein